MFFLLQAGYRALEHTQHFADDVRQRRDCFWQMKTSYSVMLHAAG